MAKSKRLGLGNLVKNKDTEKPHYVKVYLPKGVDSVTLKAGQYINFETKKFKLADIERRVAGGWLSEEKAEAAREAVGKIPDYVIGELVLSVPVEE